MKKNLYIDFIKKNHFVIVGSITVIVLFVIILLRNNGENKTLIPHRKHLKKISIHTELIEGVGGAFKPDVINAPFTSFNYTITQGESIYSIVRKFGIDDVSIVNINTIKFASYINAGMVIQIPNQDGITITAHNQADLKNKLDQYNLDIEEVARINDVETEELSKLNKIFLPGVTFDSVTRQLMLGEYFIRPAYGRITSLFGYRYDPWTGRRSYHSGVDIANHNGGNIYAAAPGRVIACQTTPVYGNNIKIRHTSGYVTMYGHLARIYVRPGQWVQAGTVIGRMGSTGRSTGTHLHFEVTQYGRGVNPLRVTIMR